jgi:hypothetical protein
MFSPAKVITALALAFAIGGAFLIAQPFDQQGSVPGAATDDPAMAPSFFSAKPDDFDITVEPVGERREDGVVDYTGETYTFSLDANDSRISGAGTLSLNETDYRNGATTLAPTGDIGTIRTGLLTIANDEGSWEGPAQFLQIEDPEFSSVAGWLTGTDAYEGLSTYVVWDFSGDGLFHGHITAEGPPPVPESPPEG